MATFTLTTGEVALVDDDVLDRVLARGPWYRHVNAHQRSTYVQAKGGVLLHRFLMGLEKGDRRTVDHISGDGLDNRSFNLEVVSQGENNRRARELRAARRAA